MHMYLKLNQQGVPEIGIAYTNAMYKIILLHVQVIISMMYAFKFFTSFFSIAVVC
jgi:hypothetical protein